MPHWKRNIIVHMSIFSVGVAGFIYILFQGLYLISAVQVFTAANSYWSETQKKSINHFYLYAERKSDADFEAFESIIGDVVALREVIEQISYADRSGLRQASEASYFGFSSDLLKTIASLRNYMGPLDSFSTSHAVWEECSVKIDDIADLGREFRTKSNQNLLTEDERIQLITQIQTLDDDLSKESNAMLFQLIDATITLRNRVFMVLGLSGMILFMYGGSISYRWYKLYNDLHHSERDRGRLASFPLNNPNPVLEFDAVGTMTYFNTSTSRLFPDLEDKGENHEFIRLLRSLLLSDATKPQQTHHHCIEYQSRYFDVFVHDVQNLGMYHVYVFESTIREVQRSKIEDSLREKDLLIAEIHHRVNNNLAVILGFLELTEFDVDDEECARLINRNASRIQTVAHVNRMLYEQGDYINVNFAHVLSRNIFDGKKLRVSFDVEPDLFVNVNLAMPLALLMNEVAQDLNQSDAAGAVTVKAWMDNGVLLTALSSPDVGQIAISNSVILEMLIQQSAATPIVTDDPSIFFGVEMPLRDVSGSVATKMLV